MKYRLRPAAAGSHHDFTLPPALPAPTFERPFF